MAMFNSNIKLPEAKSTPKWRFESTAIRIYRDIENEVPTRYRKFTIRKHQETE
jgi:hypothetical protein